MDPSIDIHSTGGKSSITLRVAEATVRYPSVRCEVVVSDEPFAGAYDGVWIEMDAFDRFASDLARCEATRRGSARLVAMSPEELEVVVEGTGSTGRFVVTYRLGRYGETVGGPFLQSVAGAFALDVEYFGELARNVSAALKYSRGLPTAAAVDRT